MATTIGTLVIEMSANVSRLTADMEAAKGTVNKAMQGIEASVEIAKKAFIALAGVGSAMAFKAMVDDIITAKVELQRMSIQTGASVEALSAIGAVAKVTGTSVNDVAGAINKLQKNLATSNEDSKGAATALKALGINFAEFIAMSPDDQMLTVAKSMDKFEDGGGKSAAAMLLFGKTGAQLLPMLTELATKNELIGKTTSESAQQAEQYEKNIKTLNAMSNAWKRDMVDALLPTLEGVTKAFVDARREGGALAGVMAGLQTLFTGTDQYKSDKQITEQAQRMMELQNSLDKARGAGYGNDTAMVRSINAQIVALQAQIKTTMVYRTELKAVSDAEADREKRRMDERAANGQVKVSVPAKDRSGTDTNPGLSLLNSLEKEYDHLTKTINTYGETLRAIDAIKKPIDAALKQQILDTAALIDAEKNRLMVSKMRVDYDVQEANRNEDQRKLVSDFVGAQNDAANAIIYQTQKLGLNAEQLQRVNAQEQVDIMLKSLMKNATSDTRVELEKLAETMRGNVSMAMDAMIAKQRQLTDDPAHGIDQATKDYAEKVRKMGDAWKGLSSNAIGGFEDTMTQFFTKGKADWKSYFANIYAEVVRLQLVQPLIAEIFKPGVGAGTTVLNAVAGGASGVGDFVSGISSGIGSFFGMLGFADGGRPPLGRPSVVGERGPEIFIPDSAGTVIPNGAMGKSISLTNNINIDARTDSAVVYSNVSRALQENNQRFTDQLRQQGVIG